MQDFFLVGTMREEEEDGIKEQEELQN